MSKDDGIRYYRPPAPAAPTETVSKVDHDAVVAELAELKQQALLPADAKARLVAVQGIGDALADKALAALTAPAQE